MSILATLAIAVELDDDGKALHYSQSTNLQDWAFWRQVVDQLYIRQLQQQASDVQREQEAREENM